MCCQTVLLLLCISIAFAQRQPVVNNPKCVYTFLTESAVCGNSNHMQEIAQEFRPGWRHIKVIGFMGIFSLAGRKCLHLIFTLLPLVIQTCIVYLIKSHLDADANYVNSVEDLDLSHIGTVAYPSNAFLYYTSLIRLNLANTSVRSIDDNWFISNSNIVELDLSHNELTTLQGGQFRNVEKLRLLNLMDNNIESIGINTFQDLNQLTHLNLRLNKLQSLTDLGHLSRLQHFDLAENSINEVKNIHLSNSTTRE